MTEMEMEQLQLQLEDKNNEILEVTEKFEAQIKELEMDAASRCWREHCPFWKCLVQNSVFIKLLKIYTKIAKIAWFRLKSSYISL